MKKQPIQKVIDRAPAPKPKPQTKREALQASLTALLRTQFTQGTMGP